MFYWLRDLADLSLMMKSKASDEHTPIQIDVGHRLREVRTEQGLSIRALAEQSGLNVNTLSMIENGKTSPSVSTLQQAATALNIPITKFFTVETPPQRIVFLKAHERNLADFAYGTLADLGAGFSRPGVEPFIVDLQIGADSGDTPIVHTGLEFVFCLQGRILYEVDSQPYALEPGDSLLFEAHLPHRWRNTGEIPSRSLLLLCSVDERDRPDEIHFSHET